MTATDAAADPVPPLRFLSLAEVKHLIPMSTSGIYAIMRQGKFPQNIQIGPNRSAWIESEVKAWMQEKIRLARGERE